MKTSKAFVPVKYLLSLSAFICGIVGFVLQFSYGKPTPVDIIADAFIVSVSVASAVLNHYGKDHTVAAIAAAIGFSIALKFTASMLANIFSDLDDPNFINTVFYFIVAVFGYLILYSSIRLLLGHSRNAGRLAVYIAVPLILTIVWLIYLLLHKGMSISDVFINYHYVLPYFVMMIIFEVAVFQSKLIGTSSVGKVKLDVECLSYTTITPPDTKMKRSELVRIVKHLNDSEPWEPTDDGSSVQFSVTLGKKKDARVLLFRRLPDIGRVIVTVLPESYEGYINPLRFILRGIIPMGDTFRFCNKIRMFGDNGVFIDILISDDGKDELKFDDDASFIEVFNGTLKNTLVRHEE